MHEKNLIHNPEKQKLKLDEKNNAEIYDNTVERKWLQREEKNSKKK